MNLERRIVAAQMFYSLALLTLATLLGAIVVEAVQVLSIRHALANAANAAGIASAQVARVGTLRGAAPVVATALSMGNLEARVIEKTADGNRLDAWAEGGEAAHIAALEPIHSTGPGNGAGSQAPPNRFGGPGDSGPGGPGGMPPDGGPGRNDDLLPPPEAAPLLAWLAGSPRSLPLAGGRVDLLVTARAIAAPLAIVGEVALGALPVALLLGLFAGRGVAARHARTLAAVITSLESIGEGDLGRRIVEGSGQADLAKLVSAHNRATETVEAALARQRRNDDEIRLFVADAGHALRTPLTVVMGFIDIVRQSGDASTQRMCDTMLIESRRMRTLVDRLVYLARLENAHDLGSAPSIVDLGDIASGVRSSLASLAPIELERVPDALISGNEDELREAVSVVAENAVKYGNGKPVRLVVAASDGTVSLSVIDRGPGIRVEEQHRIFDRFYRGGDVEGVDGLGLGLAIAKRAVERARGTINVHSSPGEGTRMQLVFPRAGDALP